MTRTEKKKRKESLNKKLTADDYKLVLVLPGEAKISFHLYVKIKRDFSQLWLRLYIKQPQDDVRKSTPLKKMNVQNLDMCAYSLAHEEEDQVHSWNNLLRKLPRAGITTPA